MGVVDEVRIWLRTPTDEEIVVSMDTPNACRKNWKIHKYLDTNQN